MCNESKPEGVVVRGDREPELSVAQPQLQRAVCEEPVSKRKALAPYVTRQGIREGTGGLSFLYRVSVISPAQRSDSPVGDVSSPAARSLAWALSLSLPLPCRGPGGHVTRVGPRSPSLAEPAS